MKVALCFAGQPRYLQDCWPSIKQYLVQPNRADVFFHTWASHPKQSTGWFHNQDVRWPVLSEEQLLQMLQPKAYILEPQIEWDISSYPRTHTSTFTVMSFLYSISRCHQLYNPLDYDYVIHSRMDLEFHAPVELVNLDTDTVYMEYRDTSGDQFAYGYSDAMQRFSKVFDNFDKLYTQVGHVHGETFIETHISNCGLRNIPAFKAYSVKYK